MPLHLQVYGNVSRLEHAGFARYGSTHQPRVFASLPLRLKTWRILDTPYFQTSTASTLNELLRTNQLSDEEGYCFIEQLDEVSVQLISAKYQDEGDITKGGIEMVRDGLYRILSTSQRFEQSRTILRGRLDVILMRLQKSYAERLNSLERELEVLRLRVNGEGVSMLPRCLVNLLPNRLTL